MGVRCPDARMSAIAMTPSSTFLRQRRAATNSMARLIRVVNADDARGIRHG
jgi:hypothetical protein